MVMFVNGRRVITNAPGAIVRSISKNYTTTWHRGTADFENICKSEDLQNCCEDVTVDGYAVATIDSFFPQSYGDELGLGGGVKSGTINGKAVFKSASPDVFVSSLDGSINKAPVVREGDMVVSNNGNCDPAPIEYLPGYQINNPCQTPNLKENKAKTSFYMPLIVHGKNQKFYGHFVNYCLNAQTHNQSVLATFDDKLEIENLSKRLYLNNVEDKNYAYGFYQNSVDGQRIAISFLGETHNEKSLGKAAPKKSFEDESMQVVLLRLVMAHQLPKKLLVEADNYDFSDIFRLSDGLRARVYQSLLLHKLTMEAALFDDETKESIAKDSIEWANDNGSMQTLKEFEENWYEIISADLQQSVDEQLSKKIIGSMPDGFIYVYLDGHVWREIECRDGQLHEVDLRQSGGTNNRKATGLAQDNLMLPYKIAGKDIEVEVAFSEQQWRWARIRYYGGMSKKDERRIEKIDPVVEDAEQAAKNRAKRFIKVDLKALLKDKNKEVENENGSIQLFEEFNIYHLVLPDPLLPIQRAMSDIFHLQNELQSIADNVHNPVHCAHGSSASLIYKYFFDPKGGLIAKQKSNKEIKAATSKRREQRLSELNSVNWKNEPRNKDDVNDDIRQKIDLDKIKATLKVERRQRIRELIRALQHSLVSLVQRTDVEPITTTKPGLVTETEMDWQDCIKDWFAGSIETYAKAFSFVGTLSNALNLEPSDTDIDMELERDTDKSKPTPGSKFIVSLHEKSHPLYDLIHPNKEALDKAKKLPDVLENEPFAKSFTDYKDTDEDTFNIHFFKFISSNKVSSYKNVSDAFNAIIKDMVSNYQLSLSKEFSDNNEVLKSIKPAYSLFTDYIVITDNQNMPETEIKLHSEITDNEIVIGTHASNYAETSTVHSAVTESDNNGPRVVNAFKANNANENELIIATKLDFHPGADRVEVFDFKNEKQLALEVQKNTVQERQAAKVKNTFKDHVVIVAKKEVYQKSSLYKKNALHLLDMLSSGALLVLSVWNIELKLEAIKKSEKEAGAGGAENYAELTDALLSTSYMVENVARSFSDLNKVFAWYEDQSVIIRDFMSISATGGFAFTPLSFLATIGSSISVVLSLKSLYCDLKNHSPKLLLPHLAKLGVSMATTLSFIGSAAERAFEKRINQKLAEYAANKSLKSLASSQLKKMALAEVLETTSFGMARKALIRLAVPFASTYVGLLLLVSGFLLDFIIEEFKDSELLTWVKASPFVLPGFGIEPKDEANLLAEFASIMLQPKGIVAATDEPIEKRRYFVEIQLPFFDLDNYKLQVLLYSKNLSNQKLDNTFGFLATVKNKVIYSDSTFFKPSEKEIVFDESLQLSKLRFYINPFANWPNKIADNVKLMCQFRIILDSDISLPLEKFHGEYLKKHDIKNSEEAYVYHAEPLSIIGQGSGQSPQYHRETQAHDDLIVQALNKKKDEVIT